MNRSCHRRLTWLLLLACCANVALAASAAFDALSAKEAAGGLREALAKGIDVAVAQLGANDGFLKDPQVMIPLPPLLAKAQRGLAMLGMGPQADELKATMNHAAESAVAQARPIFKQALQRMTLTDAKSILTGGDGAATAYFRRATSTQLIDKFKPVVAHATARLGLSAQYDRYAGKASRLGLIPAQDADLDDYVTAKALEGLFSRIAAQEHAIRKDPLRQTNSLIRKAFGAL
ncbi:MAG TPA: DUF4197 domain-containing protein [Steroidobacteraceae bacterium]|jgi:hypothetical protein|nr:DUF4197 domain-containing protein [Steroidobacteraceae bacterium]